MYLMDPKTIGAVTMPGPQACLQDRVCVPSEVKLRQQDHTHMVGGGLGGRTRPTPVIIRNSSEVLMGPGSIWSRPAAGSPTDTTQACLCFPHHHSTVVLWFPCGPKSRPRGPCGLSDPPYTEWPLCGQPVCFTAGPLVCPGELLLFSC